MENFAEGSIVCMRTANIQARLDESDLRSIPASLVKSNDKLLSEGDILVSTANSLNLVGKCCWVPKLDYAAAPGGFIAVLRADPAKILPRYLYHWFSSPKTQADARNCSRQTTNISNMDLNRCLALQIPLPALAEQRRIAAILDKADALRVKRHEAITKLDLLLEGVFLHRFGDPVQNPKRIPTKRLRTIAQVQTGGTPPSIIKSAFDGSVPFVTPGDLGGLVTTSRRTLTSEGARMSKVAPAGSTLVCCIGATIGKMGFLRHDSAFNQQINAVTWGAEVDAKYGYYAMRFLSGEISRRGTSTTLPILKKSAFEELEITIPALREQQEFGLLAIHVERQKENLERHSVQLEQFFHSLLGQLFSDGGRTCAVN